ncbi:putative sporulation protein (polysaccharide deacetylase family) [Paenibacillus sp. DS2015]|uniref:polysaccharide deacetylase family protein n=1 Tax=Paenibacillus sp. DS2015 TaxID=3373917 RepID=UPI003D1A682F
MYTRRIAVILACFTIVIGLGQAGSIRQFIEEGRLTFVSRDTFKQVEDTSDIDPLYQQIKDKATQTRIEPIDARLDRVWKVIPGYNGMELDVEATYKLTENKGRSTPIRYIHRVLIPKVSIADLGADPIYRGNPNKPMVSLMINVAWGNEFIIPMLDILDQEKVKATFFFDGSWLKKNIDLAKVIQQRGHELSNHAYSHPNMSQLSKERAVAEISKTQQLLKDQLGVDNLWFAPPSGDFNDNTVKIARELGMYTVLWTLDTVDWRKPSPESIVDKISSKVEPGNLILMHPTSSSSRALQGIIQAIKGKGLVLGTVTQTLSSERVDRDTVE